MHVWEKLKTYRHDRHIEPGSTRFNMSFQNSNKCIFRPEDNARKQLFNHIDNYIEFYLWSGRPRWPLCPDFPNFSLFKEEKKTDDPSQFIEGSSRSKNAMQTCVNTQIQTIQLKSVHVCMNAPVVLEALWAQQDQAGQRYPGKYRQNGIWIHSNQCDAKQLIFRRTLSPWNPISPGSPRFPTSP